MNHLLELAHLLNEKDEQIQTLDKKGTIFQKIEKLKSNYK